MPLELAIFPGRWYPEQSECLADVRHISEIDYRIPCERYKLLFDAPFEDVQVKVRIVLTVVYAVSKIDLETRIAIHTSRSIMRVRRGEREDLRHKQDEDAQELF